MHWIKAFIFSLLLLSPLQAQIETATDTASKKLSYLDAVILGLVEGVTEYLPISSTGHLIVAFLPAAVIGLLLNDWIETNLGNNINAVAGALIVGAFAMLGVEHWRKRKRAGAVDSKEGPELHELSLKQSLMIGFIQCLAMWPGTSRSMATIVGGYLAGLSPKHAAEFSFLLGLITLTAASGYKFVSNGEQMLAALEVGPVFVGCVVTFISAVLAVKWLVAFLSQHGLALFAWYRIALAIAVFIFMSS